jgi:hypothetical protein
MTLCAACGATWSGSGTAEAEAYARRAPGRNARSSNPVIKTRCYFGTTFSSVEGGQSVHETVHGDRGQF